MKYKISAGFQKDFGKLKNKDLATSIREVIADVASAKTITAISGIKKMKGHSAAYRVRKGDYRIGFFVENETVIFAAFAHRKDIYKQFP